MGSLNTTVFGVVECMWSHMHPMTQNTNVFLIVVGATSKVKVRGGKLNPNPLTKN